MSHHFEKSMEQLNQQRFWKSHMHNLKDKTIMHNKIHNGDILPEQNTAKILKQQCNFNLTHLVRSINPAQIIKSEDNNGLQIIGDVAPNSHTEGVKYSGNEKPELKPHLQKPYIYSTKIINKQSFLKNDNLSEVGNYVNREFENTGNEVLDRLYTQYVKQQKPKQRKKEQQNFWNTSTNTQSHQDLFKLQSRNSFKNVGIVMNEMKGMDKEQRQEFQQSLIKKQDEIQQFLKNIKKLIKNQAYQEKINIEFDDQNFLNQPNIKLLWKAYVNQYNLRFDKKYRTDHILIEYEEFKDFILALGWTVEDEHLIQQFFNHIHDENTFKDDKKILTQGLDKEGRRLSGNQLKQKFQVEVISMRAFVWNYNKFIKDLKKIEQQYSHLKGKQINVNIRESLKPWKENFKAYEKNQNQILPLIKKMLKSVKKQDVQIANKIENLLQEKNKLVKQHRVITNNLYKQIQDHILDYNNIKEQFVSKILKFSSKMALLQEFIEGFKAQNEIQYINNDQETNLSKFTLIDFAEYIRKQPYNREEVDILIEMIKQVYKYCKKALDQYLHTQDFYSYINYIANKKQNSYVIYKGFLEAIEEKLEKQQQRIGKQRYEKIEQQDVRLYHANRKPVNRKVLLQVQQKLQKNLTAQILYKQILKSEASILKLQYIICSLIKVTQDYNLTIGIDMNSSQQSVSQSNIQNNDILENQEQEMAKTIFLQRVQQILEIQHIPKEFNTEYLFSDKILVMTRKTCEQQLQETNQLIGGQQQQFQIEQALKIFTHEAERLKEVLYQWKYPNYEESDIDKDEEVDHVIPDNEGKIINVMQAVQKSHDYGQQLRQKLSTSREFKEKYNSKLYGSDQNFHLKKKKKAPIITVEQNQQQIQNLQDQQKIAQEVEINNNNNQQSKQEIIKQLQKEQLDKKEKEKKEKQKQEKIQEQNRQQQLELERKKQLQEQEEHERQQKLLEQQLLQQQQQQIQNQQKQQQSQQENNDTPPQNKNFQNSNQDFIKTQKFEDTRQNNLQQNFLDQFEQQNQLYMQKQQQQLQKQDNQQLLQQNKTTNQNVSQQQLQQQQESNRNLGDVNNLEQYLMTKNYDQFGFLGKNNENYSVSAETDLPVENLLIEKNYQQLLQ